jgi:hypothetical protein
MYYPDCRAKGLVRMVARSAGEPYSNGGHIDDRAGISFSKKLFL